MAALITYTKADGSTRLRELTIFSRDLNDGQTHALNCRQAGETITKRFLLSGISRLEVPGLTPPVVLNSSQEITAWLETVIPESPGSIRRSGASATQTPGADPQALRQTPTIPDRSPASAPRPEGQRETTPAAAAAPKPLPGLLPDGARGFAVLDLETTGTGRHCRIVEIALVRLDPQGRITEEWETLVHPGVPIPNAHIHRIDDGLVNGAPSFAEIAGLLAAKLHEHVLVAHNLKHFDGPILEAHFAQVDGLELSLGSGLDTMPKPRLKLVELCRRHGVVLDPEVAHTALGDTRALTRALQCGMAHLEPAGSAVRVELNELLAQPARPLTRAMAASSKAPVGWSSETIALDSALVFITTGPASMKADTDIKRAEAHGLQLGLDYRKMNSIPKRQPPSFLLSTSLSLTTRKMVEARELGIPVVLCRDFMQARRGSEMQAWRYQS
ncbi:MAG: exonuclease domain-containing protein [Cyanobacteriota bacterium]